MVIKAGIKLLVSSLSVVRVSTISFSHMAARESTPSWRTQFYLEQKDKVWPKEGRHILAQYDEDSVVVYQAYCPEIAEYAVKNQKFGGDRFSYQRMSWVKTNFLWMMYRCGWASKRNQERVLAIWVSRKGFDTILAHALTGYEEKRQNPDTRTPVRLQWDPDHTPSGEKEERRAIQLGLRDKILASYGTDWIVKIEDITDFVHEQHRHVLSQEYDKLQVAEERVYRVEDEKTVAQLGL